jgi:hypothetical protein
MDVIWLSVAAGWWDLEHEMMTARSDERNRGLEQARERSSGWRTILPTVIAYPDQLDF